MRAWAAAAAVQPFPPSTSGITPFSAQRLSVEGETPARRAASLRVSGSSCTALKLQRPDAAGAPAAVRGGYGPPRRPAASGWRLAVDLPPLSGLPARLSPEFRARARGGQAFRAG